MSGKRWDFESGALGDLAKKTGTNTADLGDLVKQLAAAAEPLEGKLEGSGPDAFKAFKSRVDQIAKDLNAGMASIAQGQQGLDAATKGGQTDMTDAAKKSESGTNFDAAKFKA